MDSKKDYFHLYLGSFVITDDKEIGRMVGLIIDGKLGLEDPTTKKVVSHHIEKCKLILRPLSNMSEAEALHLGELHETKYRVDKILNLEGIWHIHYKNKVIRYVPNWFSGGLRKAEELHYMIKREFDVFGLVSKGFAVYSDHNIDFAIMDAALSTKNT